MKNSISKYHLWAEDVNKTDVLSWIEEELSKLTPEQFGETCVTLIVHERSKQ